MSKQDFYQTLGVSKSASADEIKKAYRKLAMQYHPDKNPGDKAAEKKFKEISEANDVLSDAGKRAKYDQYGHDSFMHQNQGGGGPTADDIFSAFMGGGGGGESIFESFFGGGSSRGESANSPQKGASKRTSLTISFLDAVKGVEKEIQITRYATCSSCDGSGAANPKAIKNCSQCRGTGNVTMRQGFFTMSQPCPSCHGAGKIISDPCKECSGQGQTKKKEQVTLKIPAGIDNEMRLRVAGKGDAGHNGGPAGDLHVTINVEPHSFFERDEDNILCDLPVSFTDAALGGKQEITAPSGKKYQMEIPAGVQNLKILSIPKEGFPSLRGNNKGDFLIRINVETPVDLSDKQKELLRKFRDLEQDHNSPRKRKFLNKVRDFFGI